MQELSACKQAVKGELHRRISFASIQIQFIILENSDLINR
jgi:hypothetical protein